MFQLSCYCHGSLYYAGWFCRLLIISSLSLYLKSPVDATQFELLFFTSFIFLLLSCTRLIDFLSGTLLLYNSKIKQVKSTWHCILINTENSKYFLSLRSTCTFKFYRRLNEKSVKKILASLFRFPFLLLSVIASTGLAE